VARRYVAEYRPNYPILLDRSGRIADDYGISGTPTLVGINAGGVVRCLESRIPVEADEFIRRMTAGTADPEPAPGQPLSITRESLLDLIRSGGLLTLVDLQPPKDFHRTHIRGAINIPLDQIDSLYGRLKRGIPVVLYGSGSASAVSRQGAEQLQKRGFRDVRDYAGGIREWTDAGLPVETGAPVCFIARDELLAMWRLKPDLVLIDTRASSSYAKMHIARAINIPLEDLERWAASYDRNALIVVYCTDYICRTSTVAALKLIALGFKSVHDFKGGLQEWKESNLPLEGEEVLPAGETSSWTADDDSDIPGCCP
jgi:rhodanese-related sulfurtransferase